MRVRLIVVEGRPLECVYACHLDCFRKIATDVQSRRHGKRTWTDDASLGLNVTRHPLEIHDCVDALTFDLSV